VPVYGRIIRQRDVSCLCGGVNTSLMIRSIQCRLFKPRHSGRNLVSFVVQRYAAGQHGCWLNGVPIVAGVSVRDGGRHNLHRHWGRLFHLAGRSMTCGFTTPFFHRADILAIYNQGTGTELDAPAITFPSAANVWTGSGTYGWTGADITPTKALPRLPTARRRIFYIQRWRLAM